jgi:hypothetical protein
MPTFPPFKIVWLYVALPKVSVLFDTAVSALVVKNKLLRLSRSPYPVEFSSAMVPLMSILPLTESVFEGLMVPIPTLPAELMRNLSDGDVELDAVVLNIISAGDDVPVH